MVCSHQIVVADFLEKGVNFAYTPTGGALTELRNGKTGAPNDQEYPADATDPGADRQNFLDQNENRQSCNPEQVHHAAQEQQTHQHPAAPQAVSSVLQPHLDSALPARAPMTH